MGYRKLKADHLFDGQRFVTGKPVLIVNADHSIEEIVQLEDAGGDIETFAGILTPGFINAHCHLELSHMKGLIPTGTGLVDFVFKVVTERHFPDSEIQLAIETAERKMYQTGIVAVGDICNNLSTLLQKRKNNLTYYNFIEASGWNPDLALVRFERTLAFYSEFSGLSVNSSIIPHAPYSVSDPLWKLIASYFKDKVVSIHNQETIHENEFFIKGSGDLVRMYEMMKIDNSFFVPGQTSSLQTYFEKLNGASSVLLVHNTFISRDDIEFLKRTTRDQMVSYCICINANLFIENAVPPLEMMMAEGCHLVLGTDSLASNHSLNLLDEMKTIQDYFPSILLEQMLTWATFNGARALEMSDKLGSFEIGKRPGIVLIENASGCWLTPASSSTRLM